MFVKRFVKEMLYHRRINPIARALLKPISFLIPNRLIPLLPVLCDFSVNLPDGKSLILGEQRGQDLIARILYWKGFKGYEYETVKLFYGLAEESNTVFDVGANIGYYALLAAIANKQGKVYAFEPVPKVYERLERNVALNECSNIINTQAAVTNFAGDIPIYVPRVDIPVSASTLKGFREGTEEFRVPAIMLDTFAKDNHIAKLDLMKIDTEATEHDVLEGARNIIQRDEPMIICEVLYGRNGKALEGFFSKTGYRYYWITDKGLVPRDTLEGDNTYKYRDYLFCPEDKLVSTGALSGRNA